jgi:hypothetical protein
MLIMRKGTKILKPTAALKPMPMKTLNAVSTELRPFRTLILQAESSIAMSDLLEWAHQRLPGACRLHHAGKYTASASGIQGAQLITVRRVSSEWVCASGTVVRFASGAGL